MPRARRTRVRVVGALLALVLVAAVLVVTPRGSAPSGPHAGRPFAAETAAASAARRATGLGGGVRIRPGDGFHRFRLDAVAGAQLTPNRRDLAARTVPNGPLLLFLPATRAAPGDYTEFLTAATNRGYHVLGLDYWNLGRTLSRTCGSVPRCYTDVQRNRFDGSAPSAWSDVQPTGSIISRLRNALTHLDDADPAGGWGRFLVDGRVQWRHIVIAGHSQGGSQAAYIGHVRRVDGVLMFGAPAISDGGRHASWLDHPGKTPPERYYALAHRHDELGSRIRPSWSSLALHRAEDPFRSRRRPPTGDPHALLTAVRVPPGERAHAIVVSDRTPRDRAGNPVLLPVWNWMLERFDVPLTHPEPEGR